MKKINFVKYFGFTIDWKFLYGNELFNNYKESMILVNKNN